MIDPMADQDSPEPQKQSLRAAADTEGVVSEDGRVSREWLEAKASEPGSTGRRARLAFALSKRGKK